MRRITHPIGLFMILAAAVAVGQSPGDAELAAELRVHGVMVSSNNQVAIINNRLTRVGEQIGAAEVLAIEPSVVHLRVADRTFAMRVGSSVIRESGYADARDTELESLAHQRVPEFPPEYAPDLLTPQDTYGPVAPGETLSNIAASMTGSAERQELVMAALYESNPQAFGKSMDMLYAGAVLQLPLQPTDLALAGGTRIAPAPQPASAAVSIPVNPGDTLSEIAASLWTDGITLNQLMLSIFVANPESFGGNVNLLYANTVLKIPDANAWRAQSPEAAHEEVTRQASVWVSAQATNST